MKIRLILLIILFLPQTIFSQIKIAKTPNDVVDLIKQNVTCIWEEKTVDTFKAGNADAPLKGIATCMFADMSVLKDAVKNDCNFIITHEPIFYNHMDDTTSLEGNPVFQEKLKFIKDNHLTIFRFHDHIHQTKPDGIYVGMIEKMGLVAYLKNSPHYFFNIPETTVADFSKKLKKLFNIESVRLIGNADMKFTKLAFAAGAPGGQKHIKLLESADVEVLIAGEAPEWETYLYANDAAELGKNKAVIFIGHIKSEEAGMKYCADWLKTFIDGIPIMFIENKPNFRIL